MSLLTGSNLSLGYEGKAIVKDVSFAIEEGDYLCIVGENGAGKSTLMKTILGLMSPIEGEITFADGLGKNEIGYLPQQTTIQRDFPASVEEIVISGCQGRMRFCSLYTKKERMLAEHNIERMHLKSIRKKCYRELSGGQQQRVLLARALCATQKILLLDEPVAGLDPKVTSEMYELIENLNKEGLSVIMITHDVQAAIKYATHILHIKDKPFFGTKGEYMNTSVGKSFISLNNAMEDK